MIIWAEDKFIDYLNRTTWVHWYPDKSKAIVGNSGFSVMKVDLGTMEYKVYRSSWDVRYDEWVLMGDCEMDFVDLIEALDKKKRIDT